MPLNQNHIKMLDQQILNPLIDLSSIQDSSAIELKSILEERLSLIEEDLEESLYDYVAGLPDNNDALKAFSLVRECLFQSHPQNLSLRDANEIKKNSHNLSPHLQERASLIASMNFNEEEDYYQSILHNITLQNGVELLEQPFGVLGISVADTPEHRATKDDVKTHIEQRLNYAKEFLRKRLASIESESLREILCSESPREAGAGEEGGILGFCRDFLDNEQNPQLLFKLLQNVVIY